MLPDRLSLGVDDWLAAPSFLQEKRSVGKSVRTYGRDRLLTSFGLTMPSSQVCFEAVGKLKTPLESAGPSMLGTNSTREK